VVFEIGGGTVVPSIRYMAEYAATAGHGISWMGHISRLLPSFEQSASTCLTAASAAVKSKKYSPML